MHEMMHWGSLFRHTVPEWNTFIQPTDVGGYIEIVDYNGEQYPYSGYGPFFTQQLYLYSNWVAPQKFKPFPTLNNADSYVW